MFRFKADQRDPIIALLRQQLEAERLRVTELTRQVIALSSRGAYRELYPAEKSEEKREEAPSSWVDPRKTTYRPRVSAREVEEAMTRKLQKES